MFADSVVLSTVMVSVLDSVVISTGAASVFVVSVLLST